MSLGLACPRSPPDAMATIVHFYFIFWGSGWSLEYQQAGGADRQCGIARGVPGCRVSCVSVLENPVDARHNTCTSATLSISFASSREGFP